MKIKTALSVVILLLTAIPAFAESTSMTVQVTCTIPPMMEMSAPLHQAITAHSNLSDQYRMTEDTGRRDGQTTTVYSITAL